MNNSMFKTEDRDILKMLMIGVIVGNTSARIRLDLSSDIFHFNHEMNYVYFRQILEKTRGSISNSINYLKQHLGLWLLQDSCSLIY